jgi:phosphatidylserine decarboxylase
VVKDGIPFVLVPLFIFIALIIFKFWLLAIPFLLLAAFMAYFFRDPEREISEDPDVVVSPADGRVTRVERLEASDRVACVCVSIFLSPLDVHINRSPISGKISKVAYTKGKFMMATREDASLLNEQNALEIENERITLVCKQIAGILARRIVCWKNEGDTVNKGERFGLIKFSSRTDLIMPENVQLEVREGDRVKGGTTVIGRIKDV